ncbi:uncharacterized protein LOC141939968 isoform X3 [Strix uralensis]|uniref:uncharacterized protein LOC141939968 isoform X3 n=1 Tax=Strix uralensis TaxID=36305 RepID=UPI003DA78FA0
MVMLGKCRPLPPPRRARCRRVLGAQSAERQRRCRSTAITCLPHVSVVPCGLSARHMHLGLCVLQVTQGHLDPQSKSSSEVCQSVQTQAKEEQERGPLQNIFLGSRLGRLTPWGRVEQRRCQGARSRGTIYAPKSDRGSEQGTVRRCKAGYRHRR